MVIGRNFPNGVKEKVPSDEGGSRLPTEGTQIVSNRLSEFAQLHSLLWRIAGGYAILQFIKRKSILAPQPLLSMPLAEDVNGAPPGEFGQIGGEHAGPMGWDRVPGPQIGVADAFLTVLVVSKNTIGDFSKILPVFSLCLPDGDLISLPV